MPATFTGIQNENEFYSHHYLAELFANDIQTTTARWRDSAAESANGKRTPDLALRALARPYLRFRQQFARERRNQARIELQRDWFRLLLTTLGYDFEPANYPPRRYGWSERPPGRRGRDSRAPHRRHPTRNGAASRPRRLRPGRGRRRPPFAPASPGAVPRRGSAARVAARGYLGRHHHAPHLRSAASGTLGDAPRSPPDPAA